MRNLDFRGTSRVSTLEEAAFVLRSGRRDPVVEYVCKVGTPAGEVIERSFAAADEVTLRADLERQGYYLFAARRGRTGGTFGLRLRPERVKLPVLLFFAQEMAALLRAGLPLYQALDILLERQKDGLFRRSLATVQEKIKSGTALSEAFREEGERYPSVFSASLMAGERSGNLEEVLQRFVQYLRLSQALKKKLVAASVYPLVLATVMAALVVVLLVVVIPAFEEFYADMDAELPTVTVVLMSLSDWVQGGFFWIVGAGVLAVFLFGAWFRQEGSGAAVDRVLLRLPYVGKLLRTYAVSQLARTLATLLSGGLPLLNAMEVAARSLSNRALSRAVEQAAPSIREGRSLTDALEATNMLDHVALEMIKVGEQTGALAEMLRSVADFFDEELDTRLATMLALVEPIMLVLIALVVAAMLLAFYLPLFQLFSTLSR